MRHGPTVWLSILPLVIASCKGDSAAPAPPAEPRPVAKPVARAAGDGARGAGLYAEHCASCHGEDRRGGGPGRGRLSVAPRNLSSALFLVTRSDEALSRTVREGGAAVGLSKEMPRFADELSEQDAQDVVAFLRRGAVALDRCAPGATHFLVVGRYDRGTFLAAYGSAIPAGGRPVVLSEPEQVPLGARKEGYVLLTGVELPRGGGPAPAAVVGAVDGKPTALQVALPPGERERAEAELSSGLYRYGPALAAVAAGKPPPGYLRAGARGGEAGRSE